jgi:hypothetical protein
LIVPTYSTAVRAGRSHPIESRELCGINTQRQSRIVELWRKRFDGIDFNVFPYLESDSGNCLVTRFLSCVDISGLETVLRIPDLRINQSLSSVGIESLRIFNGIFCNLSINNRHEVIQVIESETSKYRKSVLTEKQFEDAKKFSEFETLKLQEMMQPIHQTKFRDQDPLTFAQISQDLISLIYENEIKEVISKAKTLSNYASKG